MNKIFLNVFCLVDYVIHYVILLFCCVYFSNTHKTKTRNKKQRANRGKQDKQQAVDEWLHKTEVKKWGEIVRQITLFGGVTKKIKLFGTTFRGSKNTHREKWYRAYGGCYFGGETWMIQVLCLCFLWQWTTVIHFDSLCWFILPWHNDHLSSFQVNPD